MDCGFDGATADLAWINRLALDRPADWVVVTGDDMIRRNRGERIAWKRSGLRGFVLARGFQKMPVNQGASLILWRWPDMARLVQAVVGGSLFELPIGRGARFSPLSV